MHSKYKHVWRSEAVAKRLADQWTNRLHPGRARKKKEKKNLLNCSDMAQSAALC